MKIPNDIDVHNPVTGFERFYSFVWKKHFPDITELDSQEIDNAVKEELIRFNGALTVDGKYYNVTFKRGCDCTAFLLRW